MDAGVKRSWHVKQRRFLIFNPPWHLVVTNLHFTQDGMTTILFVFRWYQIGHAVVHLYVFRCLKCSLTENQSIVAMWSYVISSSWPSIGDWIVANLERLPLPTSRIHLKITLFITCQDPLIEEVDLCYRTQRGSCFAKWRLYFFFVRTFWFNYHLWRQGFSPFDSISTSTV